MDIEKFKEIFRGLNIAYGKFIPSDTNDAGKLQVDNKIIRQPNGLPDKLWEDHLNGTNSLGIIPIDEINGVVGVVLILINTTVLITKN